MDMVMDMDTVMDMVMEKNKTIKQVDIHEYLPVLIEILNDDKDVNLLISGGSMTPFLVHQRDTIIISKPKESFKRGDMVFYQRLNGQYVMHRIHHVKEGMLYIVGDAQTVIEGPVDPKQVFGIIHKAIRKGKLIQKGDFWWDFFEKIWIRMVPLRPFLVKCYSIIKHN